VAPWRDHEEVEVQRVDRTKDQVSRAYWVQAFFENAQVLFPAKHLPDATGNVAGT